MSWFLIALIGPILYATTNHIDKFLISKYLRGGAVGSLIIFSSIFSVFALPIVFWINPSVFDVSILQGIVLAVNGSLIVFSLLCYFYALQSDEASYVVPLYQTIPVFGFILSYFILGENLTSDQLVSSVLVIIGAIILSFEIGDKGSVVKFKLKSALLMLTASFLYAINGVVFKLIAVEDGFWPSTFWSLVGKVLLGICFLLFIRSYREQFLEVLRVNRAKVLALNSTNETLSIVADAVSSFALLLAPVALVLMVGSFQPLFVLLIGIGLTLWFPTLGSESMGRRHIVQKTLGILLILAGALMINL